MTMNEKLLDGLELRDEMLLDIFEQVFGEDSLNAKIGCCTWDGKFAGIEIKVAVMPEHLDEHTRADYDRLVASAVHQVNGQVADRHIRAYALASVLVRLNHQDRGEVIRRANDEFNKELDHVFETEEEIAIGYD